MIGYLGPKYSFTYQAASSFYVEEELRPFDNVHFLFEALKKDKVEGIVVPIENVIEGTINDVQDKVLEYGYHISREIDLDIQLSLISKANSTSLIKTIIGHKVDIGVCRNTLYNELGKYKEIHTDSCGLAITRLLELDESYGAIAPSDFVEGELNILKDDTQDIKNNKTRFIYVRKALEIQGFHNKTSIAITPSIEDSGALYDILHEFSMRDINLTKIESRTLKSDRLKTVFFIDFEGNIEEDNIKETLEILGHKTSSIKLLGSYLTKK